MTPPLRTIAVDWSGARDPREQKRRIWVAEAQEGRLVSLVGGRTRDEVAAWLIGELAGEQPLRVGFDFAFGFPAWYAEALGCADARAVWRRAAFEGETWLAGERPPFWGRRARRPEPDDPARHYRATDRDIRARTGLQPKSPFQIGGAGAVGTAAIRGMPVLLALADAGLAIWPQDAERPIDAARSVAFEIWPRLATGATVKSRASDRASAAALRADAIPPALLDLVTASEDAFDAAMAALALSRDDASLRVLPTATPLERLEGRIWVSPAS